MTANHRGRLVHLRPSKYPAIDGPFDVDQLFNQVPENEIPSYFATLDAKPSDRFAAGERYCVACVLSKSPVDAITAFDEIARKVATYSPGARLVKPATLRKKRRAIFLRFVVRALREIIRENGKLPINLLFVSAPAEELDPGYFVRYLSENPSARNELGVLDITSSHISFRVGLGEMQIGLPHYGAMLFWQRIILRIDEEIGGEQKKRSWMIHLDRLPLDRDGSRTRLLASILDYSLAGRLWISYGEGEDWKVDLLTDIFVNLCYERFSGKSDMDEALISVIDDLIREMGVPER